MIRNQLFWVLISGVLLTFNCQKGISTEPETTLVKRIDIRDAIKRVGEVRCRQSAVIKCEASGRIEKIFVQEGSFVKKGDPLLFIDSSHLQTARERLLLELEMAKITLTTAERKLDETEKLVAIGNEPERTIADRRGERDVAALTLKQKTLDLRELNKQLSKTRVISPISGIVTSLDVIEGDIAVSATESVNGGTSLATISDISRLEVISQIGEADFTSVKLKSKVVIIPEARKGVEAQGQVWFVALAAKKTDSNLGTFEVRVAIDSAVPGIAPGVTVNVEFVLNEKKGVVGVPCEFVTCTDRDTFVTKPPLVTDKSNTMRKIAVTLGATDYKNYEIVKGIAEGDTICRPSDKSANFPGTGG
jgi:HlyD family secretion protein